MTLTRPEDPRPASPRDDIFCPEHQYRAPP